MGKRSTLSSFCHEAPKKHSSIALRISAARPRRIAARFVAAATLVLLACLPSSAQEARWKELFAQAGQLKQQGKPVQALPIAQEAERVAEATFGPENAYTLASINRLATIYDDLGRYSEAEPLYKRAIGIGIKTLGPESEGIGAMLNNLAALNEETERYADSERFYKGALAINEKLFGPANPAVAINLNNIGLLYTMQGRFAEAEPLYRRALAIDQKSYGDENPHVAINLNNLGLMYTQEAHYAEAEPLFKQALAIDQKSGINSSAIATDIHNLAALYELEGHQSQSEDLYKRALTIYEKQLGPDHPNVADTLGRLSQLYSDQGLYGDAEPPLKRSLAIYEKVFGQENLSVATSMSDLGLLYVYQGRGPEAEPLLKQSLAIREKALGPDHPQLASAMYRVAYLYEAESRDPEAEPLLKRALAIHVKELGEESRPVGADVSLLGVVCIHEGRNSEAETYLKRAVEVVSKSIGPETREMASTLTDLAGMYQGEGKYADAEPLYKRAQTIFEKVLGAGQPEVYTNLFNLTGVYEAMGRHDEANSYMERGLSLIRQRFEYNFSYMSEKDRLQFLASVHGVFPAYFSFAVARHDHDPAAAGKMFDLVLWEKGIVGTSVSALRARVAASGDSEAVKLMDDLTAKKSESAQLATSRPPGWVELQSKLDAEANELEQQLARHVSGVGEQKNLAAATWQEVQKSLKPGDAAVEIVRYQFHDGKNWTNNYRYAALVVTPRASSPSLIVLGDAKKLESTPISNYRTNVALTRGVSAEPAPGEASTPGSGAGDTTAAYDAFWKPLEPALAGVKRVYVSPDGVLNQLPISLFADSSGKMLLEKYELRYVNSTKDLLRPPSASSSKSAVLLGNPKFDLTEPEERADPRATERRRRETFSHRLAHSRARRTCFSFARSVRAALGRPPRWRSHSSSRHASRSRCHRQIAERLRMAGYSLHRRSCARGSCRTPAQSACRSFRHPRIFPHRPGSHAEVARQQQQRRRSHSSGSHAALGSILRRREPCRDRRRAHRGHRRWRAHRISSQPAQSPGYRTRRAERVRNRIGRTVQQRRCLRLTSRIAGSRRRRSNDEHVVRPRPRNSRADGPLLRQMAQRPRQARSPPPSPTKRTRSSPSALQQRLSLLLGRLRPNQPLSIRAMFYSVIPRRTRLRRAGILPAFLTYSSSLCTPASTGDDCEHLPGVPNCSFPR